MITPSIYLGEMPSQTTNSATTEYVASTTREAVRLAKETKPVLPVAWLQYDNFWDHAINKTAARQLLSAEHAAIELATPLANGADGVLIWGHLDTGSAAPTSPESLSAYNRYSEDVLHGLVSKICAQYQCCSNLTDLCLPPALRNARSNTVTKWI